MQSERREKTCAQVISATEPPPSKKFEHSEPISKLKHLLGFDGSDISSFRALVSLLYSPKDPSSLGVLRIGFGRFCTIIATKLSPVKYVVHHTQAYMTGCLMGGGRGGVVFHEI